MNFNKHYNLEGQHAFLSASKYHWVNYDDEKLASAFSKYLAAQHGTRLHEFAREAIELGIKLPKTKKTLNMYVNDAIGFKMDTEVVLYYSDNCFGTADSISFKQKFLRIHDLKNGVTVASMTQLVIYAALFCLEYGYSPNDFETELRIYQNDDVVIHHPEPEEILYVMEKIITADKQIELIKMGERV